MHTSDSGVDGTYVPNMSKADNERWKAKHITGENERIEIRVSIHGVQVVIVVRKFAPVPYPKYAKYTDRMEVYEQQRKRALEAKDNIKISMNGSLWLSHADWRNMTTAVKEAEEILAKS